MAGQLVQGVVVDFDFAVLDGSTLLFEVARKVLGDAGVDLDIKLEAMHLVGGNYQGGIAELFESVGVAGDAAKCAHEVADGFRESLVKELAEKGIPDGFKAFAKAIAAKGARVVLDSRIPDEVLKEALGDLAGDFVVPYHETSVTYGGSKWDAWKRAARANKLVNILTAIVAGSGHGVKAAIIAGYSSVAFIRPRVAYQDFGGADLVIKSFDAKSAAQVLNLIHIS